MASSVPSLTLSAALRTALSQVGIGASSHVETVTGLSSAAVALTLSASAETTPICVVVPTDADVETVTSDARLFYQALHGGNADDVTRAVLPFPSPEVDPYRGISPHLDVASARARALTGLAQGTARLVVASASALLPRVSRPARLLEAVRDIRVGGELSPTELQDVLGDAGFVRADPVDAHGEFCGRGGVVDFFPVGDSHPTRVEFVGDTVESLRLFDPGTQRSVSTLDRARVIPLRDTFEAEHDGDEPEALARDSTVLDFLEVLGPRSVQTCVSSLDECERRFVRAAEQVHGSYASAVASGRTVEEPAALILGWDDVRDRLEGGGRFEVLGLDTVPASRPDVGEMGSSPVVPELAEVHAAHDAPGRAVSCQPAPAFHGRLTAWVEAIRQGRDRGDTQVFVAATSGRAERITEVLAEHELTAVSVDRAETVHGAALLVTTGLLSRGFRLPDGALQIYTETDIFDEERRVHDKRKTVASAFLSDLRDLKVGHHVVHVEHGIGSFVGLRQLPVGDTTHELMELRYAEGAKLFVPVEHLDLIQKYTGARNPSLDRLGGTTWERAKTRVKRAMRDMADELLSLYAARQAISGHTFSPDTHWQEEFESAFAFDLTPDQATAVRDIKKDMETATPMDRLLCGDVGYGKTEVAVRAIFKAVMDGKQVALLSPTTVLAFQHAKTLAERFAAFPVRVEMVSRFRSRADQKTVLADLATGSVDVLVGTHRLLSKDVKFRDLGLVVVDEEQRFGVAHKERLKTLRKKVDVLTLTATPIPRTLNMSLMGLRDMSVIETPPKDRLSIQTNVVKFDAAVVAQAIQTELDRGGQVYLVHNRIESIDPIAAMVRRLLPDVRLVVAHGRSDEAELQRTMIGFVEHQYDVLLSTTIIENGLDIPNVNTIIINHAERYGLAQLYQLRGRVGRSDRRAYAYLLIPSEDNLSQVAQQRLAAIKEFSDLGSGFRVAALDLEIRGAGNLLGAEQSGQIEAIGFDMYVKLLEQTVSELKGEPSSDADRRATVNLGIELRIDEGYVAETNQRLALYRRVASVTSETELATLTEELLDRYGPPPPPVERLLEFGRIRILADRLGIDSIDREKHLLVLKFRDDAPVDSARLVGIVQARPDVTLTPPATLGVDLGSRAGTRGRGPRRRLDDESTSWWTARATAGEVTAGFSKGALTEGGRRDGSGAHEADLVQQVSSLLAELSGDSPGTTIQGGR